MFHSVNLHSKKKNFEKRLTIEQFVISRIGPQCLTVGAPVNVGYIGRVSLNTHVLIYEGVHIAQGGGGVDSTEGRIKNSQCDNI